MVNVAVKVEFEQGLYEDFKKAIAYFSQVPLVDPQTRRFVINPETQELMTIVSGNDIHAFLKAGAIKIVEDYNNPTVRQGCDNLKQQLIQLQKQAQSQQGT